MDKATLLKVFVVISVGLGLVTAGVCMWIMVAPEKVVIAETIEVTWASNNHSPKIGITTGLLMISLGICAWFIGLEKRLNIFTASLCVVFILATAFMIIPIKDHHDWKNVGNIKDHNGEFLLGQDSLKTILTRLKILAAAGGIDMVTMLIGLIFYMNTSKDPSRNVMQIERHV